MSIVVASDLDDMGVLQEPGPSSWNETFKPGPGVRKEKENPEEGSATVSCQKSEPAGK